MRQSYDKEKVSLNVARLKTHGYTFEVAIDPDNAIKYRHGEADIREALKAEHIYKDVAKGELAAEEHIQEVFKTSKPLEAAEKIIREGGIQISDDYRDRLKSENREKIMHILLRDAADASTGKALSKEELEQLFQKANVNIDLFQKPEDQISIVVDKLKPVLALTFEKQVLDIRIPAEHAAKLYGLVSNKSKMLDEAWLSDGSWTCKVEMRPGDASELIDELKSRTHGAAEIEQEKRKE